MLNLDDVAIYVEKNVGTFHAKRLEKLQSLNLNEILKRKNPYLFKAKNILTAHDLVKNLLDAFLQSQEETLFGDFLEGVAIFVCEKAFGGKKSNFEGIDLEFERDDCYYVVEIKSGPNWGNSSQIKRMKQNFKKAQRELKRQRPTLKVIAVNGCCYGRESRIKKDGYLKICGQEFWKILSDSDTLYADTIEPLGYKAKEKNEEFLRAYSRVINQFALKFSQEFCEEGDI